MRGFGFFLIGMAALGACTEEAGLTPVPGMREITPDQAKACAYVMNIRAEPGVYGPLAQQGLQVARNQVFDLAREHGANAVVFEPVSPGTLVTEIRGTAYRC